MDALMLIQTGGISALPPDKVYVEDIKGGRMGRKEDISQDA